MAGFSVTGSIHLRSVHTPAATVPRSASTGPSTSSPSSSAPSLASSISASCRVTVAAGSGVSAGSCEELRRRRVVDANCGHDAELQDLAGRPGIGDVEVVAGNATAERLVGADVGEDVVPDRDVREVDDHVGPLGEAHQQPVAVIGGQIHRRGEEAALVADLPHLHPGDAAEVEDQEPRLAAVEKAEAVTAPLHRRGTARCCR